MINNSNNNAGNAPWETRRPYLSPNNFKLPIHNVLNDLELDRLFNVQTHSPMHCFSSISADHVIARNSDNIIVNVVFEPSLCYAYKVEICIMDDFTPTSSIFGASDMTLERKNDGMNSFDDFAGSALDGVGGIARRLALLQYL